MRHIGQKNVIIYTLDSGKRPFRDWLDSVGDKAIKNRIWSRLLRLAVGHYGDCEVVGGGVYELKLKFGAGYRIYFGEIGEEVVILLCGGDKSTQKKDIEKAKLYFRHAKGEHYEQR